MKPATLWVGGLQRFRMQEETETGDRQRATGHGRPENSAAAFDGGSAHLLFLISRRLLPVSCFCLCRGLDQGRTQVLPPSSDAIAYHERRVVLLTFADIKSSVRSPSGMNAPTS